MSYTRRRFQMPGSSQERDTKTCADRGFHVATGPAKRRVCQHCGELLPKGCEEQVPIGQAVEAPELEPAATTITRLSELLKGASLIE